LQQDPTGFVVLYLGFGAFLVVGALVVAHRPSNAIGWIFSAVGLLPSTGALAAEYANHALVTRPGSLPGGILAAWYASWPWYPALALALVFAPLLFPTGRLLSRRWRPVAWLAGLATLVLTALASVVPELSLGTVPDQVIANPIGVAAVGNPVESRVGLALTILLVVLAAAAFGSLVIRFRRSRGEERQQLKWFTYAAALLPLALVGDFLPAAVGGLFYAAPVMFLPVAAGIAILRHRLYDIDRLINRTLVYGLLTAILGFLYVGAVLLLGNLFGGIGGQPPSWAVAGITLVVAALFQPVRHRIQQVVDRRFNRHKYDAARTIETFATRLRDELDLDSLSAELLAVVDQTMEPIRVSLWLRPTAPASSGTPRSEARPATWAY
jgi:MFS family permease